MSDVYRINPEVVEPEFTERGIARLISDGVLVPVEPNYIGAILRECLPLITDNQVADVIEALGAGIGDNDLQIACWDEDAETGRSE